MINFFNLFVVSFLAGSFIPLSSEAYLLYLVESSKQVNILLIVASLGNTIGAMSCYYIAKIWGSSAVVRVLKLDEKKLKVWEQRIRNKGVLFALFCWLPFVGDFIAAALGVLKLGAVRVFIFILIGKTLRYMVVLGFFSFLQDFL